MTLCGGIGFSHTIFGLYVEHIFVLFFSFFFFQAEDGIRDLVRSRGLGDVYKRQDHDKRVICYTDHQIFQRYHKYNVKQAYSKGKALTCLLYTSDAADERSSVDLGGSRIIKKKNNKN